MQIDIFTVLVSGLSIQALLGTLFLLFWLNDRRSPWFGWWSAAYALSAVATLLFMLRGQIDDVLSIALANAVLLFGIGCSWHAARAFERRPMRIALLVAAPTLWLIACLVPAFFADLGARIVLASVLGAGLHLATAWEFWRGRDEPLLSRWPVIVMFSTLGLLLLLRIPLAALAPFPVGALPMDSAWLAAFQLAMFVHIIILTVLVVSLSKERLEYHQRTQAQTDPLTGALNRRAFAARGIRLLQRHEQTGAPLCLLALDLDRFKGLNDSHGHAAGDKALVRFVTLVHDCIRPTDLLFRLGGEEFCCLLPNTGTEQGREVAERIRARVQSDLMGGRNASVRITVSAGLASTDAFGHDIDELMSEADLALYEAKRAGRNRIAVARRPLPTVAVFPTPDDPPRAIDGEPRIIPLSNAG